MSTVLELPTGSPEVSAHTHISPLITPSSEVDAAPAPPSPAVRPISLCLRIHSNPVLILGATCASDKRSRHSTDSWYVSSELAQDCLKTIPPLRPPHSWHWSSYPSDVTSRSGFPHTSWKSHVSASSGRQRSGQCLCPTCRVAVAVRLRLLAPSARIADHRSPDSSDCSPNPVVPVRRDHSNRYPRPSGCLHWLCGVVRPSDAQRSRCQPDHRYARNKR